MVDIPAAMTLQVAQALKEIAPIYSEWVEQCAKAKIENERLRAALKKITMLNGCHCTLGDEFRDVAFAALNDTK